MHQDPNLPAWQKGTCSKRAPAKNGGATLNQPKRATDSHRISWWARCWPYVFVRTLESKKRQHPKIQNPLYLASNEKWNPNNQVTKLSHQNPIPFFSVVTCLFCCLIFVTPRMAPAPLWGAATPGPGRPGIWTIAWLGKNRQLTRRYRRCPDLGKDGTFQHITQRQQKSQKKDAISWCLFWWIEAKKVHQMPNKRHPLFVYVLFLEVDHFSSLNMQPGHFNASIRNKKNTVQELEILKISEFTRSEPIELREGSFLKRWDHPSWATARLPDPWRCCFCNESFAAVHSWNQRPEVFELCPSWKNGGCYFGRKFGRKHLEWRGCNRQNPAGDGSESDPKWCQTIIYVLKQNEKTRETRLSSLVSTDFSDSSLPPQWFLNFGQARTSLSKIQSQLPNHG